MTKSMEAASFTVHEAKTHLSRILRMVESGAEVTILRGRTPIARLLPIDAQPARVLGTLSGRVRIADDFDAPLSDIESEVAGRAVFPA